MIVGPEMDREAIGFRQLRFELEARRSHHRLRCLGGPGHARKNAKQPGREEDRKSSQLHVHHLPIGSARQTGFALRGGREPKGRVRDPHAATSSAATGGAIARELRGYSCGLEIDLDGRGLETTRRMVAVADRGRVAHPGPQRRAIRVDVVEVDNLELGAEAIIDLHAGAHLTVACVGQAKVRSWWPGARRTHRAEVESEWAMVVSRFAEMSSTP